MSYSHLIIKSLRTQISLSPSLYRLLKEKARKGEKSLAAIIREKVITQLTEEEEKKAADQEKLEQLLRRVRELRGKSGWQRVKNPRALIRKWRRDEDEKRMKRIGLFP